MTSKQDPKKGGGLEITYAVEFPRLPPDEASNVKTWPVVLRFPSTEAAMELLALAQAGRAAGGQPGLLSVAQVAEHLQVARSTVDAIPADELPFVPVGDGKKRQHRRYRREDVNAYVERKSAEAQRVAEEEKRERETWERAGSSRSRTGRTGTSASTARGGGSSSGSRRTPPTKTLLGNAWLKLKDS